MPQRDISDLIARKTNQVRYLDHARLRRAGGLGVGLTYNEFIDVTEGGILQFDSSGLVVGVDTRPIVITISSDMYEITTSQTAVITFSFSQPIASFDLSDLIVANGTLSALIKVSDIIYTATFTPTAAGNASVTVPVGSVSTVEGITNDVASAIAIEISSPPTLTVTFSTLTPTNTLANKTTINIQFNMPVVTSDIIISNFYAFPAIASYNFSSLNIISSTEATIEFYGDSIGAYITFLNPGTVRLLSDNSVYNQLNNPLTINYNSVTLTALYPGTITSVEWSFNGSVITGATSSTYIASLAGNYSYIVDGSIGIRRSRIITLPS
jgi:hypothetical protein